MKITAEHPSRMFLIGPMGVGKTAIGRKLAQVLGLNFVDCDQEVERRSGASISWIFDVEGEAGFRIRESQVLDEVTSQDGWLVATGGGVVLSAENRRRLRERGIVVYLDADIDLLAKRTAWHSHRPLLQNNPPRSVLETLRQSREPLYREAADIHVVVSDHSAQETLTRLLRQLQQQGFVKEECV